MGRVLGAHGVRGAVRVQSFADPAEGLLDFRSWWIRQGASAPRLTKVVRGQNSTKGLIVELDGINDRDAAEALAGAEVSIERARLPRLPRGQYYWTDLEGLSVVNQAGISFGVVDHLFNNGAHPVLVARDGARERMVPFVMDHYIRSVDLEARLIQVEWDADF